MKKLLFTLCVFACTASFSQNLSFEETVKYINDKIKCCEGSSNDFKTTSIEVKKNGMISIIHNNNTNQTTSFNLFDLAKTGDCKCGIYPSVNAKNERVYFDFGETVTMIIFVTKADTERVTKAFIHLLTLCTKEKDPFDN